MSPYSTTYDCPKCERRIVRELSYIDPQLYSEPSKARVSTRLLCPQCLSIHEFTYRIKISKKDKTASLNTLTFKCNGRKVDKRLRLNVKEQPLTTQQDTKSGNSPVGEMKNE